jgi:hypothetical protein
MKIATLPTWALAEPCFPVLGYRVEAVWLDQAGGCAWQIKSQDPGRANPSGGELSTFP